MLLASALLNLGLDAYLVIGLGWGIAGAAIATVAAQVLQTALLAAIVLRKRTALGARRSLLLLRGLPSPRRTLSFVTYAGPMAFVLFGKIMCYNAMTLAATCGGVAALAAHQVLGACCRGQGVFRFFFLLVPSNWRRVPSNLRPLPSNQR